MAELDRAAQKRAIEIEASLPEGYAMQAAVDRIEALASETLPPVSVFTSSMKRRPLRTPQTKSRSLSIAVLVVLLVLAAQFEHPERPSDYINGTVRARGGVVFVKASGTSINIYVRLGL